MNGTTLSRRPKLLITRGLPVAVQARAQEVFQVTQWERDEPIGGRLPGLAPGHDALLVMANDLVRSEILCVAAPSSPETRGSLDRRRLSLLPRGAVVVNIARGDLVDEDALLELLANGHVANVGLDVFRGEPAIDPRWLAHPAAALLPHIGSATEQARVAMGMAALSALERHFATADAL